MAIDKDARKRIEKLVGDCRKLLETEFGAQFQTIYGIGLDGSVSDLRTLGHLNDNDKRTALALRGELSHFAGGKNGKKEMALAAERLLRELSFTTLNRFAALKLCERRDVLFESISSGYGSKGFELYNRLAGSSLGDSYERYSRYLESVFDELSLDLGALFDRRAPGAILFPRENALLKLLDLLNDEALAQLWAEDETIGWMYQYFNSKEERRDMRADSGGAPRNSRELAVRNQFFTPRYVVQFLVDNSLGRVWDVMTQGTTSLSSDSRYLILPKERAYLSRSTDGSGEGAFPEIIRLGKGLSCGELGDFSSFTYGEERDNQRLIDFAHCFDSSERHIPGDEGPEGITRWFGPRQRDWQDDGFDLSRISFLDLSDFLFIAARTDRWLGGIEEIAGGGCRGTFIRNRAAVRAANEMLSRLRCPDASKRPSIERYRRMKDPREIRMLDPACGSMHFGLYAFDLYEVMYREAWDKYPACFSDLRAAGMSREEFLTQVPAYIIEHNIHGIDIDRRCAQIAALSLWLRAQKSWKEADVPATKRPRIRKSNIACAEPMPGEARLLEEYTASLKPTVLGDLVKVVWNEMRLAGEAGSLLKIEETIQVQVRKARIAWDIWTKDIQKHSLRALFDDTSGQDFKAMFGYDIREIEKLSEWEGMEARLLAALKGFAEAAIQENGTGKRLFAEDAAAGFAFIDLCRKRYDAILMNPPFGESAAGAKQYIAGEYSRTKNDLAAAFIEMGLARLDAGGSVGAITTRTIFFLSSHTKFREEIMLKEARPVVFADLGFGVLDAMVETAAYVVEKN